MNTIISHEGSPFKNIEELYQECGDEFIIFSPYITTNLFEKLISDQSKKTTIITTWKTHDICLGVSDLELYTYTINKPVTLYINNKLHLKAYISDWEKYVFGSANLTYRGLGLDTIYNYELCTTENELDVDTELYFKKIINESILVDEDVYNQYKNHVKKQPEQTKYKEILLKDSAHTEFLISSLPMSKDIDVLFDLYASNYSSGNKEEVNCAIHDIALFGIPSGLDKNSFIESLKISFFNKKFILSLLAYIGHEGKYFGQVKTWIQKNCTNVPVPSLRDLTGNIQVLYKWIIELSNGQYEIDKPNYSERIYKVK